MKNFLVFLLTLTMLTSVTTACSKKEEPAKEPSNPPTMNEGQVPTPGSSTPATIEPNSNDNMLTEGSKLEDIVMKLGEEMGIAMPEKTDDTTLKEVFGINKEDVDEYYGEYSVVNTSSDNIIGVKAKEDKVDAVKKALEERKNNVSKTFEQYLPDQMEKAKAGKVIQKGNYLFLVIAGDIEKGAEKEIQRAEEIINSYFQK